MKLTATTQLSLVAVMQGPGGPDEERSGGFARGGWARPPSPLSDNRAMAFICEAYGRTDGFLFESNRGTRSSGRPAPAVRSESAPLVRAVRRASSRGLNPLAGRPTMLQQPSYVPQRCDSPRCVIQVTLGSPEAHRRWVRRPSTVRVPR